AARIRLGEADVMIAAGTESMTAMPQMMGNKIAMNPAFFEREENIAIAYGMGITGEKVAQQWKVTREEQDAFAAASHAKAFAAIAAGKFKAEISPYAITEHLPDLKTGNVKLKQRTVDTDEGPRPDSTAEKLAKLRPVFAAKGSVTAGNSSQMSDGAAAVLLVSEKILKQFALKPLARFAGYSVAGVPPEIMGIGPIEAIPRALAQAGITKADLDWIELNEAFAAQSLAVMKTLELDPTKVNPLGGAIALGHPLGATGAIRTATVVHGMLRENLKWGMVTMCIGTGMGAAGIFERL
ncbi:MAG: acetyl-CoA C-acyltransferase, partial [Burkholderiales bacterium]|nr:acetyl-CoA C-acyltransferase [Burkholderiales bacterium]